MVDGYTLEGPIGKERRRYYGTTNGYSISSMTYSYGMDVSYNSGYNKETVYNLYAYKNVYYDNTYTEVGKITYYKYITGQYNLVYNKSVSTTYYYYTLDTYTDVNRYKTIDGVISYYYNKYAGIVKNGSYYQGYYIKVNDNYVYSYNKKYTGYGYTYTRRSASTTRNELVTESKDAYAFGTNYTTYYVLTPSRIEETAYNSSISYYTYQYNIPVITYYTYPSSATYYSFSGPAFFGEYISAYYYVSHRYADTYASGTAHTGNIFVRTSYLIYSSYFVLCSQNSDSWYYYYHSFISSKPTYYLLVPEVSSTTSYIAASNSNEYNTLYYYTEKTYPVHATYKDVVTNYNYYINSYSFELDAAI